MNYSLSPNPVFWSIQGEGHLRGFQMAFLRLAGCSVGCPTCDTDYRVNEKVELEELLDRVADVMPKQRDQWVWVTGGEPADQDLRPLIKGIASRGWSTAIATSGKYRVVPPVDWLSVSYHGGYPLLQKYGNELKLIEGLNGLDLDTFLEEYPDENTDFLYRYVQPHWKDGREDPESLSRCLGFLKDHPNWALSRQDHKYWGQA